MILVIPAKFEVYMRPNFCGLLVVAWVVVHWAPGQAAPTIISPLPANGALPSAPLVFTFSEAMDTSVTEVTFQSIILIPPYIVDRPTTAVWTGGNTILTCTPSPAFPPSAQIFWSAYGENPAGDSLEGTTDGFFTTGAGSSGGGTGTNAITTFSVGKVHHYVQTDTGTPTLDLTLPYGFTAVTTLASNRTATSVRLTDPTASVSSLSPIPSQPELYVLYGTNASLGDFDANYPAGNYSFFVTAASSNQTVVVNLPTTNLMEQPGAPHLTNYMAAQTVDPGQTFVLGWDAFPGGTSADYIFVQIGTNNYSSPNPGTPGALSGAAHTFTIPAGTLSPNSTYHSTIGFYRHASETNASVARTAYRATFTDFSLITITGAGTVPLVLTNAIWTPGVFSFDILSTNGQIVTVEYTNVLSSGAWPKLLTITNDSGELLHIVSPQAVSNQFLFYRARNGP